MSSLNNNARRHRQLLKKRFVNEFNVIDKRSPPESQINPTNTGVPPIGGDPTDTPNPPANPPGPRPPPNRPTDTNTPPNRPTVGPPRVTDTSVTTPQVPTDTATVNTNTSTSSSSSSTSTSSSTSSQTPPPPRAQTTPTATVSTPTVTPSFTGPTISSGFSNTVATPSATGTSTESDSMSTGSIVGIVAASLIAVAAVVVVGMWLVKRHFRKKGEEEFNRNSFIRQSVHIPDDDDYRNPRPPTMIERHTGAHTPNPYNSFTSSGMYAAPPMPNINPGEMMMMNNAPVANPFSPAPSDQYGYPAQQQPVMDRNSIGSGSNHGYTGAGNVHPGSPMSPHQGDAYGHQGQYQQQYNDQHGQEELLSPQGPGYNDLTRSSVTPYQAAQYAEISRQLNIPSVANSPVSPNYAPGQTYGQDYGLAPQQQLGIDTERLPSPSPARVLSPAMSPQRVMSPSMTAGGYSFPSPLNMGAAATPPAVTPASVAHAAAMAALGNHTSSVSSSPSPPAQTQAQTQAQPQSAVAESITVQPHANLTPNNGAGNATKRPDTVYGEDDAYGGM